MRQFFILFFLLIITSLAFAQNYCEMERFDQFIYDSVDVEKIKDIEYGEALNNLGNIQSLTLDIYRPKTSIDTMAKKPLVMFVHGGGLVGGNKDSEGAVELGYLYARAGYVYSSIDYRIGWNNGDDETDCGGDTVDLYRATYRAVQDVRAAFRFLKANAAVYGIDTNFIIVEGNSAGSRLVMLAAYATQDDYDQQFYDELGSIDTAVNELGNYNFNPIALITEAAGIEMPEILLRKEIPSLFFHGTCDSIVPYFAGPTFFCTEPFVYPYLYGSWEITEMIKEEGRIYQFYTGEGAGHDVAPPDTIFFYAKDFIKDILCSTLSTEEIYRVIGKFKCAVEGDGELVIQYFYPNPVADIISFGVTSSRNREIDLSIYNSIGQSVLDVVLDFYPPIRDYTIDVSLLNRGIYYLRVSQRQEEYVVKFMK
ncbi:MAG: T9SS type A sorting domain-containing protein [Chitinophagales bacterium]